MESETMSVLAVARSAALPSELSSITRAIEGTRSILDLRDDWDGQGSPGYDEATRKRTMRLALECSLDYWQTHQAVPPMPTMTPGPDGSIDIVWRMAERRLFLNVPVEPETIATFYGKDRGDEHVVIQGELDLTHDAGWMLAWLTRSPVPGHL